MKHAAVFLLLLLCCIQGVAQQEVFYIDSLPKEGLVLDKAWKWHLGDDPKWALPGFDDSTWESVNPTKDIFDLPQMPKNGAVLWFRLYLHNRGKALQNLLFILNQSGASEWFFDGKQFFQYGVLNKDKRKIRALVPTCKAIPFPAMNKDSTFVLAIRYAFQPGINYTQTLSRKNQALFIKILRSNAYLEQYDKINITFVKHSIIFRIGAFLLLLISYSALFIYYPQQKANLFFALFAICTNAFDLIQFNTICLEQVSYFFWLNNIILAIQQTGFMLILTALYHLMGVKKSWMYWSLWVMVIIGFFVNATIYSPYKSGLITILLIGNLVIVEILRTSLKALKTKETGAWIISCGGISFLVFWTIFYLSVFFFPEFGYRSLGGSIYVYADLMYNLSLLSIPIAVIIYTGLEIAITNKSLQQKLKEIELLSIEKQHILESQNETLEQQVTQRTAELKASQAQLIQSEKLASLGELTAGIAHEIQNPLNFVNNFAEVSAEMLGEMKEEIKAGNTAEVIAIADDLQQNLSKINHHGQRASSIVKGMLEHSRASSGVKEPTNLNALADEFLRLAYHGLRAKDNNFNATMETHFEPDLPLVSVIPQDIGRVLLNLINNAFYAVQQRATTAVGASLAGAPAPYHPTITITTQKTADLVIIKIQDNGNGIPEAIRDKIFQPFFTTKPTGQGTGLGLSLSYDIIKALGGELKVETKEGEGSIFTIQIPRS